MARGILPATVYSSYVKGICTSQWVCALPEKSESRAAREQRKRKARGKSNLTKNLRSSPASFPPFGFFIYFFFLTGSHLGDSNNPLTSNCYSVMRLSGLSWPHVLSEVNFVLMSAALSSTRCSGLRLNTCYPSIPVIPRCLPTASALSVDRTFNEWNCKSGEELNHFFNETNQISETFVSAPSFLYRHFYRT